MNVLLTGATGFLGRRVLRRLLDDGFPVRCAVRRSSDVEPMLEFVGRERSENIEIVRVDLADEDQCRRIVSGCDVVYHAAAALGGCPSQLVLNTAVPTRSLMHACVAEHVKRFVLVSSLGVYGPQKLRNGSVLEETCPIDEAPHLRDAYTYSKFLQEQVAIDISTAQELPLVIVRPGVIYGDERGVLSDRIGLRLGNWLLRMGARRQVPFTYVENCADAVVLAGRASGIDGQSFNIVDDDLPLGRHVIRRCRRSGIKLKVLQIPQFMIGSLARFNEIYSDWSENQIPKVLTCHRVRALWKPLRFSNEKAKELLGWQPGIDTDSAITRTLEFGT